MATDQFTISPINLNGNGNSPLAGSGNNYVPSNDSFNAPGGLFAPKPLSLTPSTNNVPEGIYYDGANKTNPAPFYPTPNGQAPVPSTVPISTVVKPTISAPVLGATPVTTPNNQMNTVAQNTLPVLTATSVAQNTTQPLPANTTRVDGQGNPINADGSPITTPTSPVPTQENISNGSFWDKITNYISQLSGKGATEADLENKYGLDSASRAATDATNNFNSTKHAYDQQIYTMQVTNPQGLTRDQVQANVSNLTFTRDQHLANLAIIQSAANGNLTAIQGLIKTKIDAQYAPIEATIKNLEDYAAANPNISKKDQGVIQQQIDNKKALMDAYGTVVKNLATNAPANQKEALLNAVDAAMKDPNATQASIYAAAGAYGGVPKYTSATDAYGNPIAFDAATGTYKDQSGNTATPGSGSSNANAVVQNTISMIGGGVTGNMTVQQAVDQAGLPAVVNGIVKQEGGTPQGTNNPGNIKFANQPGATKGKAATDGGNFANFATPQDFQNAIKSMLDKNAATPLSDFIASYKGVKNSMPTYQQYGLLSKTDFNPSDQGDQLANLYLQKYLTSGEIPTASSLGRNIKPGAFGNITTRAGDLYTAATGQPLPNPDIVKSNIQLVQANNKLQNNLSIQEDTINKNFDLALQNLDKNNVNGSIPAVNAIFNAINTALGQPGTAQYNLQNATLQQEAGNLMAVKNASGTTVYDKMVGAGLIPKNASVAVQKQLLMTIIQEAKNAGSAITATNQALYKQIDPLQQSSNNPDRASATTTVMTGPDGKQWQVPNDKVDLFKQNGYT